MSWLKWLIVVLALSEAGWMTFDGLRALTVGDYVTPKEGPYAGQLGPLSKLVSTIGIEPRSTGMKTTFATFGIVWLVIIVAFALGKTWAWWAMLGAAIGSLWYLPIGTATSVVIIALLFVPAVKKVFLTPG